MYSQEIEALIDAALADGVLTEKEKQVLFKKAQALGIDLDEFEMVLDSRLFEKQKKSKEAQQAAPKSNKFGDVRKCPMCGAVVQSYMAKCPKCGHEIANVDANSSTMALAQKIEEIEKQRTSSILGVFAIGLSSTDRKIISTIRNFPIPNTKSDILEFIQLCLPKAVEPKPSKFSASIGSKAEWSAKVQTIDAWREKLKEVLQRAKVSLADDEQAMSIVRDAEAEYKRVVGFVMPSWAKTLVFSVVLPILSILLLYWGCRECSESMKDVDGSSHQSSQLSNVKRLRIPNESNIDTCIAEFSALSYRKNVNISAEADSLYRVEFIAAKKKYFVLLQQLSDKIEGYDEQNDELIFKAKKTPKKK